MMQIAYTVSFFVNPGSGIWNFFLAILAKFYSNNLLAMLNYRESMKTRDGVVAVSLSVSGGTINARSRSNRSEHQSGGVNTSPEANTGVAESFSLRVFHRGHRTYNSSHEEPVALGRFK